MRQEHFAARRHLKRRGSDGSLTPFRDKGDTTVDRGRLEHSSPQRGRSEREDKSFHFNWLRGKGSVAHAFLATARRLQSRDEQFSIEISAGKRMILTMHETEGREGAAINLRNACFQSHRFSARHQAA